MFKGKLARALRYVLYLLTTSAALGILEENLFKSSIAAANAEEFLRADETTHMIIIADGRALLQDYGSGKWSAPCARWYQGWSQERVTLEWAPEVAEFGRQHLKGARLHSHGHLLQPGVPLDISCRHAVVTRAEPVGLRDHALAVDAIEGLRTEYPGQLRLFTLSELEALDVATWHEIGCCDNCSRGNLKQAFLSAMSENTNPNTVPALRPPWERYHWIQGVWDWVALNLPDQPVHFEMWLAKSSPLACTMFVNVVESGKRYWFKASAVPADMHPANGASPPSQFQEAIRYQFSNEVRVAHFLSRERPASVPHVLASDGQKGWMLVEDAGVPFGKLRWLPQVRFVFSASETYAKLQLSFAEHDVEALVGSGLRDRRPRFLPLHFEKVLSTRKNQTGFARFAESGMMDRVRHLCEVLEKGSIPNGLIHGDLHQGNVFRDRETSALHLTDWSDACISHPLFDNVMEATSAFSKRATRRYSRAIGLSGADATTLRNAARPLALLHAVVSIVGVAESIEPINGHRDLLIQCAQSRCSDAAELLEKEQIAV